MSKILLYSKNREKTESIENICRSLGIEFKIIKDNDGGKELGELIGISACSGSSHVKPPIFYIQPELMIFDGLSSDLLDLFLNIYKKKGIEPVKLKAVVTPYNISWTVYELSMELIKEFKTIETK